MLEKIKQHKTAIARTIVITTGVVIVSGITLVVTRTYYQNGIMKMNRIANEVGVLDQLIEYQNTH